MTAPPRSRRPVVAVVALLALLGGLAAPTAAQEAPAPVGDVDDLSPVVDAGVVPDGDVVEGTKGSTSAAAQSDGALLARTDGERVPVMIKLAYASIATYSGGRQGLAATSPEATGAPLTGADATTGAYARQVAADEAAIVADIQAAVPSIAVGQSFRIVYGGVSATIPANQADAVAAVDGVVAVQSDTRQQLLTDASASLIGADALWPSLGGRADAGEGLIFGSLDSGVWPEHPELADDGNLPAPPPTAGGTPRSCQFGDNPLTPATDVFACNNKLIGGRAFMATYDATAGDDVFVGVARDSNGHGTHTTTTAAGDPVGSSPILGIDHGPISGMAPGAHVAAYKVCGPQGCYPSDSTAAVQQAILDGVDVINYSISGGGSPFTDPVELAFLDAYAAGVFVAASAGNRGPGATTADHAGPWVTTVAATQPGRTFHTTLALSGGGSFGGDTITNGVSTPAPVVLASAPPYNDALCGNPAPPGLFTGKVVACQRSTNRATRGFNVLQGGAVGMILYNSDTTQDVMTDSHWLPTVHISDGPGFLAHVAANPGLTATWATATSTPNPNVDDVATFSSRGPRGLTIKPDLAAPGVQVLAGDTPIGEGVGSGPPGQYYQAIAGTSMAAPHVAGAALLLKASHPDWTPGMVRSALMGSASPATEAGDPATPFEAGSGRIQVDAADAPGLLLDETAARMAALGNDPVTAVHLNIPSIDAPSLPGVLHTTRTVTNPGATATFTAGTTSAAGTTITVTPSSFTLAAGASQVVDIDIATTNQAGAQEFGAITFTAPSRTATRIPVALKGEPGELDVTGLGCAPASVAVGAPTECSFELVNEGRGQALVDLEARGLGDGVVTGADQGATTSGGVATVTDLPVDGFSPGIPATAPGSTPAGYLPLDAFGTPPVPIGDEQLIAFNVPEFVFNGETYSRIRVDSNGYIVVGDGNDNADNNCCDLTQIGDPARPNNVIAPFWTDLNGTGRPGIFVNVLTDGVSDWIVVEWRVDVFGTTSLRTFQAWIGVNGTQDISFAYDPAALPAAPGGQPVLVGAENSNGQGTTTLAAGTVPTSDMVVTSSETTGGEPVQWKVTAQGDAPGDGTVRMEASSNVHPGTHQADATFAITDVAPTITDHPDDLTVDALSTASFAAAATGGTLTRWEVQAPGETTWTTIPGETASPLAFTAHGDDTGTRYRAVFASAHGAETATDAATLTVDKLTTEPTVQVTPASPSRGETVTFTATVDPPTATGTVQFAVDGTNVDGPVPIVGDEASLDVDDIPAGDHEVTATYSGDRDHVGSDTSEDFAVDKVESGTTLEVDPTSWTIGDSAQARITVGPAPKGGTVQVLVDDVAFGAPVGVDETTGTADVELSGLTVGTFDVTAEFTGDDDLTPSTSNTVEVTVGRVQVGLDIAIDPANPVRGQDITFTATLDPAGGGGTVQFEIDDEPVGAPVAVAGDAAALTVPDVAAGAHTITAVYSGDATNDGAVASTPFTVLRNGSTTTIVEVTSGIVGEDEPVEARVTVVPIPSGGTVQMSVDGTDIGLPLTLDVSGEVVVDLGTLAAGTRTIEATFSGDDDLDPSSDDTTITIYEVEEAFVRRAYQVVLGRNGDEAGVAYWVGRIDGGLDRVAITDGFALSPEGRSRLVGKIFEQTLDRPPSGADRTFWSGRLAAGLTPEAMVAELLASSEAHTRAGGTPGDWVEKLYDAHLVRSPSTAEVDFWVAHLGSDDTVARRRSVAVSFGRSGEAAQVAVVQTAIQVCGDGTMTSAELTALRDRWIAGGRHQLRLAGHVLALLCPDGDGTIDS